MRAGPDWWLNEMDLSSTAPPVGLPEVMEKPLVCGENGRPAKAVCGALHDRPTLRYLVLAGTGDAARTNVFPVCVFRYGL